MVALVALLNQREVPATPSDVAPRLALYASGLLKLKGRNCTLGRASMVAEAGGVVLITPLQGLRTENRVNFLESGRLAWALLRRPLGLKELPHGRQTRFHTFWPDYAPLVQPKSARVSRPLVRSRIPVKAESSAGMA